MALIVEDGTGKADAEAYVSVAALDAYAAANGLTLTGTDAQKEAALRRATRFIDTGWRFFGQATSSTQALKWPRWGVTNDEGYDLLSDTLPSALTDACCELAAHALTADFDRNADAANIKREKIGEIETEYAGAAGTARSFPIVERLLATISGRRLAGSSRLVRS